MNSDAPTIRGSADYSSGGRFPLFVQMDKHLPIGLLYESNIFITPGFIFGSNGERYVRISLCATEELLREALERIRVSQKRKKRNLKSLNAINELKQLNTE
jgi:aspartate/methionine/tyrosine aminotransferase